MGNLQARLGGNAGPIVAGAAMLALIVLGAFIGLGRETGGPVLTADVVQEAAQAQSGSATAAAPTEVDPDAPSFDELRREADGTTIIAGRAAPLSEVEILLDGANVATVQADSSGGFAAIAVLPSSDSAQIVSLSATGGGEVTASRDEIILAPAPPVAPPAPEPVQIATAPAPQAEPAPRAEPSPQAEPILQPEVKTPEQIAQAEQPAEEPAPAPEQVARTNPAGGTPASEAQKPAAPDRVAVLKSDEEGVRLLNPQSPEVMDAIALDTIGYSDVGEVRLTGRAPRDTAGVRVYLDNRAITTLPVDANGQWGGDLPDVDEGVYTLRVDEVNAEGTVSSRVETPFKRESAATLAQAAANAEGPVTSITVQTGATLWAIARDRYGDGTLFVRVFEANADAIRDPDLIYPGQVFDLPN